MIKSTQTLLSADSIQHRLSTLAYKVTEDLRLLVSNDVQTPKLTIVINHASGWVLGKAFASECVRSGCRVETLLLPSNGLAAWVLEQDWGDACLLFQDISTTGESLAQPLIKFESLLECPVKTCCIFQKRTTEKIRLEVDYLGYTIPNVFVVGCGLTDPGDAIGPIHVVG